MSAGDVFLSFGGFKARLKIFDEPLRARIRSAFFCAKLPMRADMELCVDLLRPKQNLGKIPRNWMRLDGEGDYVAVFEPNLRNARVLISQRAPMRGLAGALRRLYTRWLLRHDGAIFHAACVERAGQAYLFFGRSGAGKTTVCRFSGNAVIASDDLIAIRCRSAGAEVVGLPAIKGAPYSMATGPFQIRALFILKKAPHVRLARLAPPQAAASIMGLPADLLEFYPAASVLKIASSLAQAKPCYVLHFQKNRLFWNAIENEFRAGLLQ